MKLLLKILTIFVAVGAIGVARKNQMGVKSMQDFHTLVR